MNKYLFWGMILSGLVSILLMVGMVVFMTIELANWFMIPLLIPFVGLIAYIIKIYWPAISKMDRTKLPGYNLRIRW